MSKWNKDSVKEYGLRRCAGFHLRTDPRTYARTWKLFTALKRRYKMKSVADLWEKVILLGLERMERRANKVDTLGAFAK